MKTVIALVLLLATSGVLAQTRDATPTEDAWSKLNILAYGDREQVEDHLKTHGVTIESLEALKAYVISSEAERTKFAQEQAMHICSNAEKFANDPEALAQYFEQSASEEAALLQKIIDGIADAIGETDAVSFQSYIAHEKPATMVVADRAGKLRSGKRTPQSYIERACTYKEKS